jgi:hypothetical protein
MKWSSRRPKIDNGHALAEDRCVPAMSILSNPVDYEAGEEHVETLEREG